MEMLNHLAWVENTSYPAAFSAHLGLIFSRKQIRDSVCTGQEVNDFTCWTFILEVACFVFVMQSSFEELFFDRSTGSCDVRLTFTDNANPERCEALI